MCLPQNSPHAPSNYTGRHSAAKTPPHCHIIHTQLCGQAGVCVMFSWRSPVAACGSLRSRKFPSELSGSLTNPHTHPPTPLSLLSQANLALAICPTNSPWPLLSSLLLLVLLVASSSLFLACRQCIVFMYSTHMCDVNSDADVDCDSGSKLADCVWWQMLMRPGGNSSAGPKNTHSYCQLEYLGRVSTRICVTPCPPHPPPLEGIPRQA